MIGKKKKHYLDLHLKEARRLTCWASLARCTNIKPTLHSNNRNTLDSGDSPPCGTWFTKLKLQPALCERSVGWGVACVERSHTDRSRRLVDLNHRYFVQRRCTTVQLIVLFFIRSFHFNSVFNICVTVLPAVCLRDSGPLCLDSCTWWYLINWRHCRSAPAA